MYFCIQCNQLHVEHHTDKEIVFKCGFRFVDATLYNAGLCKPDACKDIDNDQSATA